MISFIQTIATEIVQNRVKSTCFLCRITSTAHYEREDSSETWKL